MGKLLCVHESIITNTSITTRTERAGRRQSRSWAARQTRWWPCSASRPRPTRPIGVSPGLFLISIKQMATCRLIDRMQIGSGLTDLDVLVLRRHVDCRRRGLAASFAPAAAAAAAGV